MAALHLGELTKIYIKEDPQFLSLDLGGLGGMLRKEQVEKISKRGEEVKIRELVQSQQILHVLFVQINAEESLCMYFYSKHSQ